MLHNAQVVGFAEGTNVLMADGKWKAIEQVREGDMVMSFGDDRDDSNLEPRKVVNTWSGIVRDCVEVHQKGKVTIVAKDQLFFTPGASWSQSFNTKQVLDYAGTPIAIQTRNVRGGKHKLYDITVDKTHAFIANDMRVHNGGGGGGSKKKTPPQPVVTAGKPGKPVSVTTTYNGNTTTVVVNPSPGSSGQVSVNASGSIRATQIGTPSLGNDYTVYPKVLPYPVHYHYTDRISNAQAIRDGVCGDILSRGSNYRVTKSDQQSWELQIDELLNTLNAIKKERGMKHVQHARGGSHHIHQDPTGIDDAINEMKALKADIKAGKKLNYSNASRRCSRTEEVINRLAYQSTSGYDICLQRQQQGYKIACSFPPLVPIPSIVIVPERPVCPSPENYHSERIYEDNANYGYYANVANGCTYVFDPPNAPAITTVRYYKHWDPTSNKYYYDRISSGAFCATAGGNTQA